MKMKKIFFCLYLFTSSTSFAYEIISEKHFKTAGVTNMPPIRIEVYSNANNIAVDSVYAKTANAAGQVNQAARVPVQQKACLSNKNSYAMQYGYRFDLMVGQDNILDSQTFVLQPGEHICPTRAGYGNFTMRAKGNYSILAQTRASEGSSTKEANDKATLVIK